MKKAKLILAAVAVIGLVGGTVAFKAAKRGSATYYTTNAFNAIAPAANVVRNAAAADGDPSLKVYWTQAAGVAAPNYSIIVAGS